MTQKNHDISDIFVIPVYNHDDKTTLLKKIPNMALI